MRNTISGNLASNCEPAPLDACYVPCQITDAVFDAIQPMPERRPILSALVQSLANVGEDVIRAMCEDTPALCYIAFGLGIDCVQCQIVSKKFSPCPLYSFECDGLTYAEFNPCESVCEPICNTRCLTMQIDLTASVDGANLLSAIVTAIVTNNDDCANWTGISNFIKVVFGATAEVIAFQNNTYFIHAGRLLTDFEESMLPFILSVIPAPIGTTIKLVTVNA